MSASSDSARNLRQSRFAVALLNPDTPVPDDIRHPRGGQAARDRFNIYRNNVVYSLREALRDIFPRLHSLIGEDLFVALADGYIRAYPPHSPVLAEYGDHLPDFIAGFAPLNDVPYAADVARVELLWLQSYHAADHQPIDSRQLLIDDIADCGFELAPSLHWFSSGWPIWDIWQFIDDNAPTPDHANPQAMVIYRNAELAVQVASLNPVAANFLAHLREGMTAGAAMQALSDAEDDILLQTVRLLVQHKQIVRTTRPDISN